MTTAYETEELAQSLLLYEDKSPLLYEEMDPMLDCKKFVF
jgi:hypothetical protein